MNSDNERTDNDEAFAEKSGRLFRDSVEGLDGATRSRLNRARQEAIAASRQRPWILRQAWLPAGAAAAITAVAIVMWQNNEPPTLPATPSVAATDFEILMDEEDLEMLEDLEFYSWLELDGDATDANVG